MNIFKNLKLLITDPKILARKFIDIEYIKNAIAPEISGGGGEIYMQIYHILRPTYQIYTMLDIKSSGMKLAALLMHLVCGWQQYRQKK
jgi:hypothetical protein